MKKKQENNEEKIYEQNLISNRVINLTYEPQRFMFAVGVHTELTIYDLICIYRQIKNNNIKAQIKRFIDAIDKQQNVITDIDKCVLPRKYKEDSNKRFVGSYNVKKEID
jgi:hypothetical protein